RDQAAGVVHDVRMFETFVTNRVVRAQIERLARRLLHLRFVPAGRLLPGFSGLFVGSVWEGGAGCEQCCGCESHGTPKNHEGRLLRCGAAWFSENRTIVPPSQETE